MNYKIIKEVKWVVPLNTDNIGDMSDYINLSKDDKNILSTMGDKANILLVTKMFHTIPGEVLATKIQLLDGWFKILSRNELLKKEKYNGKAGVGVGRHLREIMEIRNLVEKEKSERFKCLIKVTVDTQSRPRYEHDQVVYDVFYNTLKICSYLKTDNYDYTLSDPDDTNGIHEVMITTNCSNPNNDKLNNLTIKERSDFIKADIVNGFYIDTLAYRDYLVQYDVMSTDNLKELADTLA